MNRMSRKSAISTLILGLTPIPFAGSWKPSKLDSQQWKGNIRHSVCYWIFNEIPLEEFCTTLQGHGVDTIDLIGPKDWGKLRKLGMNLGIANGAEISLNEGWNHVENHDILVKNYSELIPCLASFGYDNLICFSGQSKGLTHAKGIENCYQGLMKIMPIAEKFKVTITMELLNSKIDHPDYQCNHTLWGVELCKRIHSEYFKLLFDIYHMQIMEGDIIRSIENHYPYISHYHTGGVPGRNEIDASQELNYAAIMKAITKTGYKGSVAQEFIPTSNSKINSLLEAFKICDI